MKTLHIKNLHAQMFDSLSEFNHTMENAKPNAAFSRAFLTSEMKDVDNWTLTNNFKDAVNLMATGYHEGMQKIMKAKGGINLHGCKEIKKKFDNVVGEEVHIVHTIMGLPEQMIDVQKIKTKNNKIVLYYDCGSTGDVSSSVLALAGKNIMAFCKYCESKNIPLEIHVMDGGFTNHREYGFTTTNNIVTIKIKAANQKINPLLVSYPLTHPSMARRHLFKWIETSECTNYKEYTSGYGGVLRYRTKHEYGKSIIQYMKDNGVCAKDAYYVSCTDIASCETIDQVYKILTK